MKLKKIVISDSDRISVGLKPGVYDRLGDVIVIAGPNGGGKSRLLKLISKKVSESSLDVEIERDDREEIAQNILFLDQQTFSVQNSMQTNVEEFVKQITLVMRKCDADTRKESQKIEIVEAHKSLDSIATIVSSLTGKHFEYVQRMSTDRERRKKQVYFGDVEFRYEILSEGEKILLNYSSILYNSAYKDSVELNGSIIVIDELETHLHPEVQMDLFEGLKRLVGDTGQLIVSTHSMSIIASCTYDQLYYANAGEIKAPSRETIPALLSSLVGYKEKLDQHIALFHEGQEWAYVNFAAQCLRNPTTSNFKRNDPQARLLRETIRSRRALKILDFGCGRARLLDELKSESSIEYHGYDPFLIDSVRKMKGGKFYDKAAFKTNFEKYDFIVLCNVLHEIPVIEWLDTFRLIFSHLGDDAFLLVLEDKKMVLGEKPNQNGFIILNESHLEFLFDGRLITLHPTDPLMKSRLYCSAITKDKVESVSDERIHDTLKRLQKDTIDEFKKHYRDPKVRDSIESSRRLAFLSIQNMNSRLAIDSLRDAGKILTSSST